MRLSTPVYSWNKSGRLVINHVSTPNNLVALNWLGGGWVDTRYELVKNLLKSYSVIVTDQDLIAHDDYIQRLHANQTKYTIVFVHNTDRICASKKRLRTAEAKLKAAGFKTKFFISKESLDRWLSKQANAA